MEECVGHGWGSPASYSIHVRGGSGRHAGSQGATLLAEWKCKVREVSMAGGQAGVGGGPPLHRFGVWAPHTLVLSRGPPRQIGPIAWQCVPIYWARSRTPHTRGDGCGAIAGALCSPSPPCLAFGAGCSSTISVDPPCSFPAACPESPAWTHPGSPPALSTTRGSSSATTCVAPPPPALSRTRTPPPARCTEKCTTHKTQFFFGFAIPSRAAAAVQCEQVAWRRRHITLAPPTGGGRKHTRWPATFRGLCPWPVE